MNIIRMIILALLVTQLSACGETPKSGRPGAHTYVSRKEAVDKTLYFTGTIQPLHASSVSVPMDAVVESMDIHYGQPLKKGDVIAVLRSTELQRQYNETLTDYLKAKDSFAVARAKFTGTKNLWDAGLLSKNNYLSEKSSLDTARVTLMQSTRKLSEMLEKMDDSDARDLSQLSLAEFDKVRQALSGKHDRIFLKAPADGVLLYPPKSGEDKGERLSVGSSVKAGQVFALVGDLTGVSIEIDVPEIDIDKIRAGLKASVTGVAMRHEVLQGELVAINAQASAGNGSALPSFSAVVEIRHLTKSQQAWVKVGMSAAVALMVADDQHLFIPIAAVRQQSGDSMVTVREPDGKLVDRRISTGAAQADKVIVETGLREGDVVVYDE
ncbi:efflux RND transporter periplasmic adaptor subunit [Legionella sp. CNM-4043-24]|uniref:efflux RND transporter periplasmic adaptor subunit n=1 Tax=Legionella sp. CNM-4043-24 TaxID=3421646 RepID=UPI00403AC9B6